MTSTTLDRPARPAALAPLGRHRRDARAVAAELRAESVDQRIERPGAGRHAAHARVGGRRVLARLAGMAVATVTVSAALGFEAITAGTADVPLLAVLSVQGMAASAVLSAAWAFQDRRALGRRLAVRCWTAVAACLGLVHAGWLALAVPGPVLDTLATRATTAGATLALDTLLVAVPALLGARAGAQDAGTVSPAR